MRSAGDDLKLDLLDISSKFDDSVTKLFTPMPIKNTFLDQVTNLTPSVIAVYNIQTGQYTYINDTIKSLLGYEPDIWLQKGIQFALSKIHPDDLPRLLSENQKALDRVNNNQTSNSNPIVEFEYRMKHADGTYRWIHTYGAIYDRDEFGQVNHIINISLDVTTIKESEEKLLLITNELQQKVQKRSLEINENAKKFQALIENSTDAIVLVSKVGKMKYASPGLEKVLGYTPDEFLSIKKHYDLIHKEDRKEVLKLFTIHFKKPQDKLTTRFRVKNKSGNYVWIEVVASNLLSDSSVNGVVLNFRNITNQILAEENQKQEIRNSALRLSIHETISQRIELQEILDLCLKAIVDKLQFALAKIWVLDEKTESLDLMSIAGSEKLVKTILSKPRWTKILDGRDSLAQKSYFTNDPLNDPQIRDKSWIKNNKIQSFAGFPMVLDNKLVGILTLYSQHEITPDSYDTLNSVADTIAQGIGRKLAEEALIDSEQKYHTIFSTLTEGVVLQDQRGKILAANSSAEQILRVNFDDMQKSSTSAQKWNTYIREDGSIYDQNEFPFVLALKEGRPQLNKTLGVSRDRQTTWILTNSIPLKDEFGKPYAVASSFQDITEQKKLEKQKDEFISIASHELKTPLTTIKSFNEILKMQFNKESKALYYLGKMNKEIDRLTELVNELLDVSKIQSGGLTLKKEKLNVAQFVKEIVEDIQPGTTTHKVIIKRADNVEVFMDRYRIYQVLINLVHNAIKYSPRADKVYLSARKKGNQVIFEVDDFGIGISERDQKRVFEPFFQATTTIRQSHSGLGLGLHISKEIISRHNGEIFVKSIKGTGSTFYFTLPLGNMKEAQSHFSLSLKPPD